MIFLKIVFNRNIIFKRDQPEGNLGVFLICQQGFAAFVLFDFFRAGKNLFQRTKLVNKFGGCFKADSRNTRNIVRTVTGQSLNIDNPFGVNAKLFLNVFRGKKLVFHRVIIFYAGTDKLHQILVSGNDNRFISFVSCLLDISCNQVVSLKTFHFQMIDIQSVYRFPDNRKLGNKLFRSFFTCSFIIGKKIFAEIMPFGVKQHQTIIAFDFCCQLQKHIGKTIDGINRRSFRISHHRQTVKGPEDISRTVNQTNFFGHWHLRCVKLNRIIPRRIKRRHVPYC